MTGALVDLLQREMPPGLRQLPPTLIRYLVGDEVAGFLSLGPASRATNFALGSLRRAMKVVALDERHDWLMRKLSERLGRSMLEAFLVAERGGRRASFAIPTELAGHWGVEA
jgi:hypothetical protein